MRTATGSMTTPSGGLFTSLAGTQTQECCLNLALRTSIQLTDASNCFLSRVAVILNQVKHSMSRRMKMRWTVHLKGA